MRCGSMRPYDGITYGSSAEMCQKMAQECDVAILAFSTGKDSIAAWLQMRKYFKTIIPYYCYSVPGLSFVERSLKYYEDFFGCRIYRIAHRSLYRFLRGGIYQSPPHIVSLEKNEIPGDEYDDGMIRDLIVDAAHLPSAAYVGTGVRMADSPMRRIGLTSHGCINHNQKRFYPIYDWKKADLLKAFDESGVLLPVDYKLFGRTFDGLDYRFLKPIKEHFPEDYAKIIEWFPMAELELFRRGERNGLLGQKRSEED